VQPHSEFIYRLANLVEYAESHDLKVASLALNAAVEVIAPSIAQTIAEQTNASIQGAGAPSSRPNLRVIIGGRADAPRNIA
jgi:hypothetical protein